MSSSYLNENNRYYDRFWREHPLYLTRHPNSDEAQRAGVILRFLSDLREEAGVGPDSAIRILDVGCGRGWLTALLSSYGACEGVEPAPEAVALARSLFPGLTFHVGTLPDLLAGESFRRFDLVVSSEVLEHVPYALQSEFVMQLGAAVVPGGHCILTTPRAELLACAGDSSNQLQENWASEREVERMFRSAGFEVRAHDRSYPTRATLTDKMFSRLKRALRYARLPSELETLQKALDHRSSLYQIWCFRRR